MHHSGDDVGAPPLYRGIELGADVRRLLRYGRSATHSFFSLLLSRE